MAGSYNKVILIGRLGKDSEIRYTPSGTSVAVLSVATSENYTDNKGQKQKKTEWHRVVVWGKQAENVNKFTKKGDLVLIEGSLQTRKWKDKQGQDRYTVEIKAQKVLFLEKTNKGSQNDNGSKGSPMQDEAPF